MSNDKIYDVIMVGAGPAALTAAIYTTREDIDTLLIERGVIGGLAAVTDIIDNYPGFSQGVHGLDLADNLRVQAERFGAKIELGEVTSIESNGKILKVKVDDKDLLAQAVLVATGCDYKKTGIPGEEQYYARGVHYCATCDGAFYRDKRLAVIGGGNSALQETIFLTRFASHIDLLVRSKIKASDILVKELQTFIDSGKVSVHIGVSPQEILGDEKGVKEIIGKTLDGKNQNYVVDGVFIFIGLRPNTDFLRNSSIELNEQGFLVTNANLETNIPGVFVAGDVRSGATMQIASAAGEGATAALKIREYLEEKNRKIKSSTE